MTVNEGEPMTAVSEDEIAAAGLADDADLDDEGLEEDDIVRAKWILDDATTLAEAAQKAREFADYLQKLHDEGNVLREPISDDYGFYYKP
jgi:hypothetical protein